MAVRELDAPLAARDDAQVRPVEHAQPLGAPGDRRAEAGAFRLPGARELAASPRSGRRRRAGSELSRTMPDSSTRAAKRPSSKCRPQRGESMRSAWPPIVPANTGRPNVPRNTRSASTRPSTAAVVPSQGCSTRDRRQRRRRCARRAARPRGARGRGGRCRRASRRRRRGRRVPRRSATSRSVARSRAARCPRARDAEGQRLGRVARGVDDEVAALAPDRQLARRLRVGDERPGTAEHEVGAQRRVGPRGA